MTDPRVRPERTGWRDEELSRRHREWGWNCPAVDIDFLMVEYNHQRARALVEYKHELAQPQYASANASIQAIIDLSNRAKVPFYATRYADDFSWWRVTPLSPMARLYLPEQRKMTEQEYIEFLMMLRDEGLPKEW